MTNPMPPPGDENLRELLRQSHPASTMPSNFGECVWRRLEREESSAPATPSPFAWMERWAERLLIPRFGLSALVLLLIAGGLTGVLFSGGMAKHQAQERYLSAVAPNLLR
jgi:hypothetical protein